MRPPKAGKSFSEKLAEKRPRKLLACDGGGIRGIISIEILAKIEAELRKLSQKPDLVLAEYFDYVAGTSTGAIIAVLVSLGYSVDQVREFYLESGAEMFQKARLWERFRTKFKADELTAMLKNVIGEGTTFGSDKLQTLLMIILRNATTDSPWPLSNNPAAKYNDGSREDCNLSLPLWKLVRASTAAPTYFPPEEITLGPRRFIFVDGGVTMYNNPAFQLFLMATTDAYRLRWPTGEEKILLVSLGTGTSTGANANLSPEEMNLLYNASNIPSALMAAALSEQDLLCRLFGKGLVGDPLDREIGDVLSVPTLQGFPNVPKLFTYVRYNTELSRGALDELGLGHIEPSHVQQMDSVDHIGEMQEVGKRVATVKVAGAHFAGFP